MDDSLKLEYTKLVQRASHIVRCLDEYKNDETTAFIDDMLEKLHGVTTAIQKLIE